MHKAQTAEIFEKGKSIYVWAYPLVSLHNRRLMYVCAGVMAKVSRPTGGFSWSQLLSRRIPGRHFTSPINRLRMQTDYIAPEQRFIVCPNQDVAYGIGFCDLEKSAVVFQVPSFGSRYWSMQLLDQRSDVFGSPGTRLESATGHYLIVGPQWQGEIPAGIENVYRSPTRYAVILPRVFLDDSPQDREAIQPILNKIMAYPVGEYTGEMKITVWREVPDPPPPGGRDEFCWVQPASFWDQLSFSTRRSPAHGR